MFNFKIKTAFLALTILLVASLSFADYLSNGNAYNQKPDQGKVIYFGMEITATAADTSATFNFTEYDALSFSTYPIAWAYIGSAEGDSVAISAFIDGSYDGTNWARVDTLGTSLTAVVLTQSTKDFNNLKFPFYRIIFTGGATNSKESATTFKLWLYMYLPKDQ